MAGFILDRLSEGLAWLGQQLRRPELMVFLPAITLAAFWFGGEKALILTALGTPMVFVMAGAFRFRPVAHDASAMTLRPQALAALDAGLRAGEEGARRTACLVVQFDDMQDLLDRHGRVAQTEVLVRCGERLAAALRESDTVAPLEGGGFAVALAGTRRLDLETVIQVAARLQSAIAAAISLDATRLHVSCSVGFCLGARAPAPNGQSLLEAAQMAADEALRNGPAAIRAFQPDMARHQADRAALHDELALALEEGQICAYFQPQISTDTGAVSGFEALARWHHPTRGLLPPADFLPAIEGEGLSDRLCEVMLFQALSALARWDGAGLRVPTVGINASLANLRDPKLPDRIRWELDRFGLTPERLSIEVLETVIAATDNDIVVANIAALARMGCGIDLDDFGTGHASITSIRRFAVRRIKIDRSFILRVDEDREQQKMLSAILSMAEQLGIEALAEGVESASVHAILAQLGCRHVQGFGIARPMPLDETMAWIRRHQSRQPGLPRIGQRARGA
jgi:diguanylate cyclase (GGDEF)-like protein